MEKDKIDPNHPEQSKVRKAAVKTLTGVIALGSLHTGIGVHNSGAPEQSVRTGSDPSEVGHPPKVDDGILPGNPNVPADQDKGTPDRADRAGIGPAGQTPDEDGFTRYEYNPDEGGGEVGSVYPVYGKDFVYHVGRNGVRAKVGIDPRDQAPAEHIDYTNEHGNRKIGGGDHHGRDGYTDPNDIPATAPGSSSWPPLEGK